MDLPNPRGIRHIRKRGRRRGLIMAMVKVQPAVFLVVVMVVSSKGSVRIVTEATCHNKRLMG